MVWGHCDDIYRLGYANISKREDEGDLWGYIPGQEIPNLHGPYYTVIPYCMIYVYLLQVPIYK